VYGVRTEDGNDVKISYTAFPPGPVERPRAFRLQFHAGTIQVGDYIKACGTADPANDTIIVAEQGEYIETYAEKP
jgi:hypothetical protein